jgi:hypothetical protein
VKKGSLSSRFVANSVAICINYLTRGALSGSTLGGFR